MKREIKPNSIKTFAEHLDKRHGKEGTATRINFEIKAKSFAVGELNKEEN